MVLGITSKRVISNIARLRYVYTTTMLQPCDEPMQQDVALRRTQALLIRSVKSAIALLLTKVTKGADALVS